MAKDLHAVLVDVQSEWGRLIDPVIPPFVRANDQLYAPAMREADFPGCVLHGIFGLPIQFLGRDHEQVDVAVGHIVNARSEDEHSRAATVPCD